MTDPKWYDITVKKASANLEMLISGLDKLCDRYVIGEEIGNGGYEHYQIRAVFKVPKELATVHNQLCEIGAPEHWITPTSKEGRNFNYCEKEGKFIRSWEKVLRKFAAIELRDWQAQVEGLMQAQNERQCLVVVDTIGNHGKTYLAKYMQATHQAQYVPPMQDAQDFMAFCLEKPSKGYIFDMPRAESIKQRKGMWSAIEQIKNGYIYDKRYKFRDEWIEPPKVCVFCNEAPDTDLLSADRWYITKITEWGKETLLMPYEEGEI